MTEKRTRVRRPHAIRTALATAAVLLGLGGIARAETLYVRAEGVTLRAAADASAADVAPVARGTELTVVSRDGSWIQVQAAGKTGWVHKLKVSAEKPDTGGSVLANLGAGGSRNDYVKEAESGRAARGLSPMAEKYAQAKAISPESVAAVKRMEQVAISKKEIEGFLKEGKLGEYAE